MTNTESQLVEEPFKYKDLKVYASTEWLAGNKKKYRQVLELQQLSYIYAELTLINKNYEVESWEATIELKCFRLGKLKKEICSLDISRMVSKHDHLVYIREGWGQKEEGIFWQKGKYCWEAYVNGRKLSTKYFYIEDVSSLVSKSPSDTLKVLNIEYFEGNYDHNNEDSERLYFVEFPYRDTRYVFVELTIENTKPTLDWYSEIFIRFFNSARELKGEVVRLQKMKKGEEEMMITAGWGSNVKGSWRKGRYSVEVVFQDQLIAESSFVIADDFKEGSSELSVPDVTDRKALDLGQHPLTGHEAFYRLNELVGLKNVKRQISEHTQYIKFLQLRQDRGFVEAQQMGLHSVFMGNPGTGKTTVARLLGAIYQSMGLLKSGHVHEVDRVDLVGEYIGQTAPKVKEAFEKAKGGVLFIDEAYALARNNEDSKDFGREVIELLVKQMSHPSCDFMVVVAGYPSEMKSFIASNPGLSSRFKYYYDFEDYNLEELKSIVDHFCELYEVELSEAARSELFDLIQEKYRIRDKSFGNARFVAQLIEKAKINMGIRVMSKHNLDALTDDDIATITLLDIKKLSESKRKKKPNIAVDEALLTDSLKELDQLIGLKVIKEKIHQLVDLVRYRGQQQESVTGYLNMHSVLVGNPGTGKTTVARIMAKIFKALGILEKGHIVETDRQGLIAGFVGQTAIKTANKIDDAMGGVLFIDEAYSLMKIGASNDFGDEAIQVILKKMEDHRNEFFTIVAGYPNEMEKFLSTNPGLRSRFDHHLNFPDFTTDELTEIAQYFVKQRAYKFSSGAIKLLKNRLSNEYAQRDKHFGNARRVRQYVDEIVKQQSLRLGTESEKRTGRYAVLIKEVDVAKAIETMDKAYKHKKGSIGFLK